MKYRGFYATNSIDNNIQREDKNGKTITCDGYFFQVFADEEMKLEIDNFYGAVGFDLPNNSKEEAESFAREMIDCELKEYLKTKEELEELYEQRNG